VQVSLTIVAYDHRNIFIVQATELTHWTKLRLNTPLQQVQLIQQLVEVPTGCCSSSCTYYSSRGEISNKSMCVALWTHCLKLDFIDLNLARLVWLIEAGFGSNAF